MPNSKLEDRYFTPPDKVIHRLESAISKLNVDKGDIKGLRKAKEIIKNKRMTYQQMKNMKSFFDNYEGDGFDDEYKLMGGEIMKHWIDDSLGTSRDIIHGEKEARMNAGEENQFIKTHTKDQDNKNPTKIGGFINIKKSSDARAIMNNDAVYEEIKAINTLMNYINKK